MDQVTDLFVKFGNSVSIRGMPRIFSSRSLCFKLMWMTAVGLSTSILIWQISTLFEKYFEHPYKTTEQEIWSLNSFPDMTFCSLQPMLSVIDYERFLTEDEYKERLNGSIEYLENEMKSRNLSDRFMIKLLNRFRGSYFNSLSKETQPSNFSVPSLSDLKLINKVGEKTDDKDCSFEIEPLWNIHAQTCYTFRLRPGCRQNLKFALMTLFVKTVNENAQDHFELRGSLANGVSLDLSLPGMLEDPNDRIILGTGTENTISLLTTVRTRLDEPYTPGGCSPRQIVENSSNNLYTRYMCRSACTQSTLIRNCNCISRLTFIPPYLNNYSVCGNTSLTYRYDPVNETAESRSLRAIEELICELNIRTEELLSRCMKECQEPCNYTNYAYSVQTVGDWPHFTYHAAFFKHYIKPDMKNDRNISNYFRDYDSMIKKYDNGSITLNRLNDFFKSSNKISSNYLQVNIHFESEKTYLFTDIPEYPWESMISLVGGCFSLWLGITVMTAVEFIELFIELLMILKDVLFKSKVIPITT